MQKSPDTPLGSVATATSNPFQVPSDAPVPSPDMVKIPTSLRKHRILTDKQLERQESQTNIGLRNLYNGLVRPLQPPPNFTSPFKKHRMDEEVTSVISAVPSPSVMELEKDEESMPAPSSEINMMDVVQGLLTRKEGIKDLSPTQLITLSQNLSILLQEACQSLSKIT